jgi:glutaredoxin 2
MDFQKKNVRNICSFYASDWHLAIMLLPYLRKQMENGEKFETILKTNIKEHIEELIEKLNLYDETKEKLSSINWNITNIETEEEINEYMQNKIKQESNVSIILNGTTKQVENLNLLINKWVLKNNKILKEKNINITIISCFRALDLKENLNAVMNKYDYALNTSGVHNIEDISNIYKKVISY